MSQIKCSQCSWEIDLENTERLLASISGEIMGDEYIESFFLCTHCGFYTIEVIHDRFLGEEDIYFRGPIPTAEAESKIELIRQCSKPWDKKCRCSAHRSYFKGWLD